MFTERGISLSNFNALGTSLQPSSGLSPAGPCPSHAGDPRAGWGVTTVEQRGRNILVLQTRLHTAQEMIAFLGCKSTLSAHVELLVYQHPQNLLLRVSSISSQPMFVLGIALTLVQNIALALLSSMRFTQAHIPVCPGPSGWHPFPPELPAPHSSVSSAHTMGSGRVGTESWGMRAFLKEMEFWKSINGADQVFHQTLNLAIFWEIFKEFSPLVKQKPVLSICREIYIPANWHKLGTTGMLKYRVIFTSAGLLNFSSSPKTLPGTLWMPGADFCWLLRTGWVEEVAPTFLKLLFQIYLRK